MVWNRKFLRVVALEAVFALGLAGTALAADGTWQGGVDNNWTTAGNWVGGNVPGASEKATFPKDAEIESLGGALTLSELIFSDNATLTFSETTNALTVKKLTVETGKEAVVDNAGADENLIIEDTNSIVEVKPNATLTLKGKKVKGAGELQFSGKGTLVLDAPVTTATDLKITGGGTLVVNVAEALSDLAGTPTIADGNIVVNGENFGNTATALTFTKGDLTLNKKMVTGLATVTLQAGRLTVGPGTHIATGDGSDGKVELESNCQLVLKEDLAIKELTTADGSTIKTNGKTLTVKATDSFSLNATVTGNLNLEMADTKTATLNKNVDGKVGFKAPSGGTATLALAQDVKVDAVDLTTGAATDNFALTLGGNTWIGTLSFAKTNAGLTVTSSGTAENKIDFLAPAADATLKVAGAELLSINNGMADVNWKAEVGDGSASHLALKGRDLLTGDVELKLAHDNSTLILPGGHFADLTLDTTADASIAVDVAAQDPVLKVEEIKVALGKTLTVNRPDLWTFETSGDVTLLTAPTVTLNTTGKIEGYPADDAVAKIDWDDTAKQLVLTAKDGFKVPELKGTPTSSGNQCNVAVKVVDGKVDAASWTPELNVVPSGRATCSTLAAGSEERVLYGVVLSDDFQSGFLRVRVKKAGVTANLWGVVDVPLKRGPGGSDDSGDKVGADLSKPASWSRTAISGDTAVLTSKLKLEGTPKSLEVKASGMKNKPKAELLDAEKVVATSSVPSVSAAKDYTLRLTCKTTQAEIDAGAKIEQVIVTMSDGKTHTIPVNVKLSDMKIGAPGKDGGKTPGGDKAPGGDGGKTPGGDKEPGGDGGKDGGNKKGSSGGGCDAGFGGLALALGAAFLLKRKA